MLRFGFDVPVILRSSDETESTLPTPEKLMVQVTNPFGLEMGSGQASVTDGLSLKPCCLEPCVLSCFWGCELPSIGSEDREERHTQIPADQGITDFGPLPRERYPLVAVLTLAEPEARDTYNIVASVTVIHVPDDKYSLSARVLFQYLLTSQGNMYELKPLFMSTDSGEISGSPESGQSTQLNEANNKASRAELSPLLEEDNGNNCFGERNHCDLRSFEVIDRHMVIN
ncbi:hypothetical protein L3Q82_001180 [Scortum barcoo]|uniref:Uncharacterized protein n=1 Tax=Scortum barcoo TaxID=214431 RepID=A0ACB8W6F2_9TELE|nr:hypothetical protein L3Q82_001180 [Scortum barcoo]